MVIEEDLIEDLDRDELVDNQQVSEPEPGPSVTSTSIASQVSARQSIPSRRGHNQEQNLEINCLS